MATINKLLKAVILGEGRIVSSCELTEMQIAEAQIEERMHVNTNGFGFVLLPWGLRCKKDGENPGAVIRALDLVRRPPQGDGILRF